MSKYIMFTSFRGDGSTGVSEFQPGGNPEDVPKRKIISKDFFCVRSWRNAGGETAVILLLVLVYGLIAGASVAGLLIAARRVDEYDYDAVFVCCGVLWPIALLPAVGYLVAIWWTDKEE